jgi:IS4 transposase
MHTLLDFDVNLPAYVNITNGKTANNKGAFDVPLYLGSDIVADRFYNYFSLLNVWESNKMFFVIRHKENLQFTSIKENDLPEDRHQHILIDQIIEIKNQSSKEKYPKRLRRVVVWNDVNKQTIELISNQMTWSYNTIAELYKSRWEVEIFFRDIKQLMHIKSFIGTSENAMMIQIWTALITILLVKPLKAMSKYKWHLSNLVVFILT